MPRLSDAERLSKLLKQRESIERKIRLTKAREQDQARRDDARRKIIAGALALEHFASNPGSEFARVMLRLLDEYTRPEDRHLFDFLPKREATPVPEVAE